MNKSLLKTVMLDVDGVLVDGRPDRQGGWQSRLSEDLGINPIELGQLFFSRYWSDIVNGRQELLPLLRQALVGMESAVSAEELQEYWFKQDSWVDPIVLADVDYLRAQGLQVWLATNQEHKRAGYLMYNLGLRRHVDGILYSAQLGASKPSQEFYKLCAQDFSKDGLLLVDDTLENVEAAKVAGWSAVHWTGESRLRNIVEEVFVP